ncbi:HTH_48 domain-containing protein [Trichonephila clavata]|uniref:HTH_48 domain-containing protein n=1 Tax=Trichonephila clavata TaxID=2740835 RepID=A0A8X6HME5_TRICU|nr:HTH_48 domain-containing protein [Trichonephila clavata]
MNKISLVVLSQTELWISEYGPKTKTQSKEWHIANSPRVKTARMSKARIKSMLICLFLFFDKRGIVYKEIVPPVQDVNQVFYKDVIQRLRNGVIRVRPIL